MRKRSISTDFFIYDSVEELPEDIQQLMETAVLAREKSYSPYSGFRVGAAILLDNDKIISGSNQENASYPAGLCAERTAIFYAGAKYPEAKMLKMAICAQSSNKVLDAPIAPCGSCRQAILEYELRQQGEMEIYFMGETGNVIMLGSIMDLLPFHFNKSFL